MILIILLFLESVSLHFTVSTLYSFPIPYLLFGFIQLNFPRFASFVSFKPSLPGFLPVKNCRPYNFLSSGHPEPNIYFANWKGELYEQT